MKLTDTQRPSILRQRESLRAVTEVLTHLRTWAPEDSHLAATLADCSNRITAVITLLDHLTDDRS